MLQAELQRVREGKPMEALDVTRYRLDKPPLARRNDFAAWKKALENAHSQLGHQYNRCSDICQLQGEPRTEWVKVNISMFLPVSGRCCQLHFGLLQAIGMCLAVVFMARVHMLQGGQLGAAAQVWAKGMAGAECQH